MVTQDPPRDRTLSSRPHPLVYKTIFGLALLLVLSAWGFFGDRGYTGLVLAVVSIFVLIAVAIPAVLWRIGRRRREIDATTGAAMPFRDWTAGELEIWQGHLRGKDAAIAILLPIAAVCLGMTAFMIVLHLTTSGGL